MELTTPRLILRPLQTEDGPALAKATDESWDDLVPWMRWADDRVQRTDIGNCTIYTRLCAAKFYSKQDFIFGGFAKGSDEFILTARLTPMDGDLYEFGGFWCRSSQQNKGYMTEAVQAIIHYAFHTLNAKKVVISNAVGNAISNAMINRLGFSEEGIKKGAHLLPDGRLIDTHIFALSR